MKDEPSPAAKEGYAKLKLLLGVPPGYKSTGLMERLVLKPAGARQKKKK
jgi:hypothetical protein